MQRSVQYNARAKWNGATLLVASCTDGNDSFIFRCVAKRALWRCSWTMATKHRVSSCMLNFVTMKYFGLFSLGWGKEDVIIAFLVLIEYFWLPIGFVIAMISISIAAKYFHKFSNFCCCSWAVFVTVVSTISWRHLFESCPLDKKV